MSTTGHNANTPSTPKTGLFAMLRGLLRAKGSGAPKIALGFVLAVLATMLGVLAFTVAPALAAGPPEAPETTGSKSVTATTAVLEGVLNPHAAVATKAGWYFAYTTEPVCIPSLTSPLEGEEEVKAKPEHVEVTNLQPNKEYTFCMVATSEEGAQAITSATDLKFKTKPAPPTVESESASAVDSTAGTLEAQVNPNNEATSFKFEYSTQGKTGPGEVLEGSITTLDGAAELPAEYGPHTATVPRLESLPPGTTYYYRVVAKNLTETATGQVQSFTTPAAPVTGPVMAIGETSATFEGDLALNPVDTTYSFNYKVGPGGECTGESATPAADAGSGPGTLASEATPVTGLSPDRLYTVCFVTSNASGSQEGSPVTFRTDAEASATEVTSDSAVFNAVIDPEGSPTTYQFEYGPTTEYGSETPVQEAGSGAEAATFTYLQQKLEAATTYHYRVLVTHAGQTTTGEDHTFTTPVTGGEFALPDNRAWEQVSPVDKHGARIEAIPVEGGVIQAAEDGSAITYIADGPLVSDPEGNPSIGEAQYVSERTPAGVWSTRDIAPPHKNAIGIAQAGEYDEYSAFSPDLSRGLLDQYNGVVPVLAPATASEPTIYLREGLREAGSSQYVPLVDNDNVAPGTHYAKERGEYQGASGNLEHVVLRYKHLLTGGVPATGSYGIFQLYEWTAGALAPISILPDGEWAETPELGQADANTRDAISADGSRVFFSAGGDLYLRENGMRPQSPLGPQDECLEPADACTIQLDLPQGVGPSPERPDAQFQYATPDGERVYFTDDQRLTKGSTAGEELVNGSYFPELYEYNTGTRTLTDLTPSPAGPGKGESGDVLGEVIGATENGEYVYFAANSILTTEANANGEHAVAGDCRQGPQPIEPAWACNLYVAHVAAGGHVQISLIAVLSNGDEHDWEGGTSFNSAFLQSMTSRMSPNGRYLAFMSDRSLTGYDNRDVSETETQVGRQAAEGTTKVHHDEEVFEYDALTGKLVCASCNPTGARPHGVFDPAQVESAEGLGLLVDRPLTWENRWLAGSVPGWGDWAQNVAANQSRYLADDGRLFFDAADGLVPQDVNGKEDVYEYEPEGVGPENARCEAAVAGGGEVFKPARDTSPGSSEPAGCVALISKGTSSKESAFLDASAKGSWPGAEEAEDVFFLTAEPLVPADTDTSDDLYDAHECSAHAPCTPPAQALPPCTTTDSCRAAPAAQPSIYGAPASATFSGAGNAAAPAAKPKPKPKAKPVKCKRGYVKKKHRCVKNKKAKRAGHNRRAK